MVVYIIPRAYDFIPIYRGARGYSKKRGSFGFNKIIINLLLLLGNLFTKDEKNEKTKNVYGLFNY